MPLDEAYFVWLYSQVGSVDNRNLSKSYWKLLRLLNRKKFTWSHPTGHPMDENRAQDGVDLRNDFLREIDGSVGSKGWIEPECSMLEMMIALSRKLAFEGEGEPAEWFWGLITNIGLIECTDANPPDPADVDEILDAIIERNYEENGLGGLFPLEHPSEDQRGVELWYQAQAYLLERL